MYRCAKFLGTWLLAGSVGVTWSQSLPEKLIQQGDSLQMARRGGEALAAFKEAETQFEKEKDWPRASVACNKIALLYLRLPQYDSALVYAKLAMRLSTIKGKENKEAIVSLNNLAEATYFLGRLPEALGYYQEVLPIQNKIYGSVHPEIANTYTFIGIINADLGNYSQAYDYHQRALLLYRKLFGENHPSMVYPLNNLGLLSSQKGEFERSLEFYNKAREVVIAFGGKKQLMYAIALNNIAGVYADQGEYKKALALGSEACQITIDLFGPQNQHVSRGYDNLFRYCMNLKQYDDAFTYASKSIEARKAVFGNKHSLLARSYRLLGDWHFQQGDFMKATTFYQKSLIAMVPEFNSNLVSENPLASASTFYKEFLETLKSKGVALTELYKKTQDVVALTNALNTFSVCDTIMEEARRARVKFQDRVELGKAATLVYESAIEACLLNHEKKGDSESLARAFYYSQRNKARVLSDALADLAAKGGGSLPVHITNLDEELRHQITDLKNRMAKLKSSSSEFERTENQLLNLNVRYDSLILAIEKSFPAYYRLKYTSNTIERTALQQGLSGKQAMLEYFEGRKMVYVFLTTRTEHKVFSFPNDSMYVNLILDLRSLMAKDPIASNMEEQFENFASQSARLYTLILEPALRGRESEIETLIIIPDGHLSYLPFEVLLTSPIKSGTVDFGKSPYLINRYNVTYGYAAALVFSQVPKTRNSVEEYLSFAPAYADYRADTTLQALGKFRDEVSELKWNQREAISLSERMGGDYVLGKDATELRFKESATHYRVIHLAVHAFADETDPMNSRIVFAHESDSLQDGFLHAYEIFDMKLNAELVVLSACNTGYGKLERGEGAMSLARAFAYAGVPSMVMSHWRVDDEATSQLMDFFYENLSKGMQKSQALRQAKLRFITTAKTPVHQHPFYWAAFTTIGDDQPVESSLPLLPILVGAFALISTGLFFRSRKNT